MCMRSEKLLSYLASAQLVLKLEDAEDAGELEQFPMGDVIVILPFDLLLWLFAGHDSLPMSNMSFTI